MVNKILSRAVKFDMRDGWFNQVLTANQSSYTFPEPVAQANIYINWVIQNDVPVVTNGDGLITGVNLASEQIKEGDKLSIRYTQPVQPIRTPIFLSGALTADHGGVEVGDRITFRAPAAFEFTRVKASLTEAQTSGTILTMDVKVNGASRLSTKLTIDNNEKTSFSANTPAVISSSDIADDDEIIIEVTQVGVGAKGLKVYLQGQS